MTLFPALGFFDSQFLTLWQVSDHLQYLPLVAPVALAIGGLTFLSQRVTSRFLLANTLKREHRAGPNGIYDSQPTALRWMQNRAEA